MNLKYRNYHNCARSSNSQVQSLYQQIEEHPQRRFISKMELYTQLMVALSGEAVARGRTLAEMSAFHKYQLEALARMLFILNTIDEMQEQEAA